MGEDLCWKCKDKLEHGNFGVLADLGQFLHCHHEPKEKPKCWCERVGGIHLFSAYIRFEGHEEMPIRMYFCPECGRPLHG